MHFDQIRQRLLQMAVEGKLIPQLETEQPNDFLVAPYANENDGTLFELPMGWTWVCLERVAHQIYDGDHNPPANSGSGVPILSAKNVHDGVIHIDEATRWVTTEQWALLDKKLNIEKDDVLLTIVGTLGRVAIVGECTKFSLQRSVAVIKPKNEFITSKYLAYALQSPTVQNAMVMMSRGTAQKGVYLRSVKRLPISLPPLREQHRIVEKLDSLFGEIDQAEKAYKELSGPLTEQFRNLILQKAIEGNLVPQLDNEPAVEALGEEPEEVPFEIPEKWKWVQLKSLGSIVGGGTPKTSVAEYWGGDVNWITPADLGKNHDKYISSGSKCITQMGLKESSAKLMPEGSVVYSSRAPIGHIAIASEELSTNQGCKSFVPNLEVISSDWGYFCLIARTPDIQSRATGTTFKEISGKGVGDTWIPLPPLEEQRRIVAKIEETFATIGVIQGK